MTAAALVLWFIACGITVCALGLLLLIGYGAVNGYADWLDRREVARLERQTWGR